MEEIKFLIIRALDNETIGMLTLIEENAFDYINANEEKKRNMRLDACLIVSKHFKTDCFIVELVAK